jgi:hypothetical protein
MTHGDKHQHHLPANPLLYRVIRDGEGVGSQEGPDPIGGARLTECTERCAAPGLLVTACDCPLDLLFVPTGKQPAFPQDSFSSYSVSLMIGGRCNLPRNQF